MIMKKKILTFKEYAEFDRVASKERYKRNVSFFDPVEGWVLDLHKKKDEINEEEENS